MAKPKQHTPILVGLFLFVGLSILGILILQYGKFPKGEVPTYTLYAQFSDATGILAGSDVRLGGAKIGRVIALPELNETFDRVVVTLDVYEGIGIPRNAEVTVASAGLLGDKYVSVQVPEGTDRAKVDFYKTGDTIEGISAGSLTSLQMKVEALSERATSAIADVQGAVTRITTAVDEFEKVARNINTGVLADENIKDLRASMEKFRKTSENLATASEKFGPMIDKGAKTFDNLDGAVTEVRTVIRDLKPVTEKIKVSVDRIGDAATSLDKGVKRISDGPGLLPALINDSSLKDEFTRLIGNSRRHGLLFYRDDSAKQEAKPAPPRKTPAGMFHR